MKTLLMLPLLVALVDCGGKTMTVSEACGVIKATLYSDGGFKFSPAEVDGLSRKNQEKIVAVKRWYKKNCN